MSHSRIFEEYAKIMSDKGLLKTADKKDTDYNTVPDKAGPDTVVEETGYELVEAAHPEQIQVAESRLNDGIVENGVEQQKIMVDVALRNPRGVLASILMKTLVKAANVLDREMSEESLKMAAEVDNLLEKIARDAMSSEDIYPLVEEVLRRFSALDFSTLGFSNEANKAAKETIYKTSLILKKFLQDGKNAGGNILDLIQNLSAFIKGAHKSVMTAISNTKDWGDDADEAREAWDNLKLTTDAWYQGDAKDNKKAPSAEQESPGVALKAPAISHHFSVSSPEVKELQGLLGITADGKFGHDTFEAVQQKATENSLLAALLKNNPKLTQGFQGWDNASVGQAILRLQDAKSSAQVAQSTPKKKEEVLNPYPEGFETGWNAAKGS